jgi:glutamate dehydrogenase
MTKVGESAQDRWAKALGPLLTKGSLPGERAGMTAALRKDAVAIAAAAIDRRSGDKPSIQIESFAAANGDRRLRLAVVNDDMPFLVDTVAATITRQGLIITRLLHPVLSVSRAKNGQLEALGGNAGTPESLIYLECDRGDARTRQAILNDLNANLSAVRSAVSDWPKLRQVMQADAAKLNGEEAAFLNWAEGGAFTLLGHAHFDGKAEPSQLLGIAKQSAAEFLSPLAQQAARKSLSAGAKLLIVKSNLSSPVHRAVPLDLLIVADGKGLSVHAGLWTSGALEAQPAQVPILSARLAALQKRLGFDASGHAGKALTHAMTELPHDIAVSIDEEALEALALTAMSIADRPRIAVELVRAPLDRHLFAFVWLPRDDLTTGRRVSISEMLCAAAKGRLLNWSVRLEDGGAAGLRFMIDVRGSDAVPNKAAMTVAIEGLVRGWGPALEAALAKKVDGRSAARLALRYTPLAPQDYRDGTPIDEAADDLMALSGLDETQTVALRFCDDAEEGAIRLKLAAQTSLALSDVVPVLENFGFRVFEQRSTLLFGGGGAIQSYRLGLSGALSDQAAVADAIAQVIEGRAENDRFNALMVACALSESEALLMRALFRYLRQTGLPYGLLTVVDALARHGAITRSLANLFALLHDPRRANVKAAVREETAIIDALGAVSAIDEDRILRQLLAVIKATLRTNMFAESGKEAIAFKIESANVPGLPAPVPWREIFVYSPRVEGIHLRAGPVARGGLRWSDRRDDFRTEILGLMKAQRVKNAVIVPTGAKGGFYPKQLPDPANREAWLAEGTESYRIFIRTLLSITDNLVEGQAVHPEGIVCHDGDDPYFVVAADKGTATFSDIANAIALERGFWLGDAFASGGSVGYDHKAMGITAKGGWVSVRRHFAEMGIDVQSEPVRVAGCGDMSGDVFGNGMLLSKAIKLVAAFDHRHIFFDPNPDPAKSWDERSRMFHLPRSSWADYDAKLISAGGGIFPRSAKSIPLSPEVKAMLGVEADAQDPSAIISAILKSKVDLLWFGGIGTYIKARAESQAEAGDKANDAHRVNAEDVQAKVVGEGANLGLTQAARIAYGLRGGRSNTDFIDNSAGVDCSDNEVNIKIALGAEVRSGRLSLKARNNLLARMTDDVSDLVLEDNRLQTLALSIAGRDGKRDVPAHIRILERFESKGQLDRVVEGIAPNDELLRRAAEGKGLTRPELAVILSTAKLALQAEIEQGDLGADKACEDDLLTAFPREMRNKHGAAILAHPLRKEIVATKLANRIVNRMGIVQPFELAEEEGASLGAVAEAFVIAEDLFDLRKLWAQIDEGAMPEATRLMLFEQVSIEMRAHMADLLRNAVEGRGADAAIKAYRPTIQTLSAKRSDLLAPEAKRQTMAFAGRLTDAGAPAAIAEALVRLAELDGAIGLSALATRTNQDVVGLTNAFAHIGDALGIDWAQGVAMQLDPEDPWERLLAASIARDFQTMRLDFLGRVGGKRPVAAVEQWIKGQQGRVSDFRAMIDQAQRGMTPTPAMLAQIAGQARVLLTR